MAICTLEDVKTDLEITDSSQDDLLARWILAATKYVETRTRLALSSVTETRFFDGNDKGRLRTDDFLSFTAVSLLNPDGTSWRDFNVSTELKAEPYNDSPKTGVVIINYVSENPFRIVGRSPYIFPKGIANVSVTATWGSYATVPDDLAEVGIKMVKAKFNKKRTQGIASASIGGESVTFKDSDLDETMKETLELYKRDYAEVW